MTPFQWILKLLERHNLEKTDARPLYQYRLTAEEYDELSNLLNHSTKRGLINVQSMTTWGAVFVIYASEWWRHSYSGHWGWDGIFDSIGLDYSELSATKRNILIETGLQYWQRDVRFHNGSRKFLGTIATEGGLPLKQLSGSGGWLNNILSTVIKMHISRGISISTLMESHIADIPKSYQYPEMEQILADITETIIDLRKNYKLMEQESPLKYLDQKEPNWRDFFPLPVDDDSAKVLLAGLVNTASRAIKQSEDKNPFELDRFLIKAEASFPQLVAQLELPTFVDFNSIQFDIEKDNFPATFEVEIYSAQGKAWSWCRGRKTIHKGIPKIKLSGNTFRLSGNNATEKLSIRFKSMGEIIHQLEVINADYLDKNLPWLFKEVDRKWILHGVASQSVKNAIVLVYIPSIYSYTPKDYSKENDTKFSLLGSLFVGDILKLEGQLNCLLDELKLDELKFKLSSGIKESIIQYHLAGKKLNYLSVPSEIFIGIPELVETNTITGNIKRRGHSTLLAKPVGINSEWQPLSKVDMGYHEVKLLDEDDNILLRKFIGILKDNFLIKFFPSKNVSIGDVQIIGADSCQMNVANNKINTAIDQSSQDTKINLNSQDLPPLSFKLSLLPEGHKKDLLITLPFPSRGALLFDPKGKQTVFSKTLYLSKLLGYRLKIFADKYSNGCKVDLFFTLIDSAISQKNIKDIYIHRKLTLKGQVSEFAINDWGSVIQSLMSISSSLDSRVTIAMSLDGRDAFRLNIAKYENELIPSKSDGLIKLDSSLLNDITTDILENTYISTLSLKQPEQYVEKLPSFPSETPLVSTWDFSPVTKQSGPWLLYPHIDSRLNFRPLLWSIFSSERDDKSSEIDTLAKAITIFDQKSRNNAIHHVLKLMGNDLEQNSWEYLKELWSRCKHLPLSTFDIWKLAIGETVFLASLLINEYEDIFDKLKDEFSIRCELIPYNDWKNSLNLYKEQISLVIDNEKLINKLVETKINTVEVINESMRSHGQFLKFEILNQKSNDLLNMKGSKSAFLPHYIEGDLQNLLRRHKEDDWPIYLGDFIFKKCQKLPKKYLSLINEKNKHQFPVIYLPMLLAWRSMKDDQLGWQADVGENFKIQQLINFDEDWFERIFALLSAWLSQQNIEEND